jgi:hypothetical protein
MRNYLMSIFKCYFNFISNFGEITLLDELHNMLTYDDITYGTRNENIRMTLNLFHFVLLHYMNHKTTRTLVLILGVCILLRV